MRLRSRLPFLVVLLVTMATAFPLSAACELYECKRTVNDSSCWIRFSGSFRLATACRDVRQCTWQYDAIMDVWAESCTYHCEYDDCYEV
jgi:hypothetical protein